MSRFGRGGVRRTDPARSLTVVAVNPRRGSGSTPAARLDLLRRALRAVPPAGPTAYLTAGGFFGSVTTPGDGTGEGDITWTGGLNLARLDRQIGLLAAALPDTTVLGVGVEQSGWWEDQRVWWYRGGRPTRSGEVVRADTTLADRRVMVGEFTLLSFVCGEVYDAGGGFDPARDAGGCDVVAVSAHTSVVRLRDRHGEPPQRYAFHRAFRRIGRTCGGVLAHAHEQDDGGYVRRHDNWVVYRGEAPFPEVQIIAI